MGKTTPGRHPSRRRPVPRPTLVVGNWKMRLRTGAAIELARALGQLRVPAGIEVVACPSYPALADVRRALVRSKITLGAQDVSAFGPGAHTGDVAAADLASLGCRYVIIGHSERRSAHGETDELIRRKLIAALAHGLSPVLCVGEQAEDRRLGRQHTVVSHQIERALRSVPPPHRRQELVVAYEPVWAISPGGPATPEDAFIMAQVIHQSLVDHYGERLTDSATRILYGGSVAADNVATFIDGDRIRGVLVGAESVEPRHFQHLVSAIPGGA